MAIVQKKKKKSKKEKIIVTWAKVVISGDEMKETVLRCVLRLVTVRLDDMGVRHTKK